MPSTYCLEWVKKNTNPEGQEFTRESETYVIWIPITLTFTNIYAHLVSELFAYEGKDDKADFFSHLENLCIFMKD